MDGVKYVVAANNPEQPVFTQRSKYAKQVFIDRKPNQVISSITGRDITGTQPASLPYNTEGTSTDQLVCILTSSTLAPPLNINKTLKESRLTEEETEEKESTVETMRKTTQLTPKEKLVKASKDKAIKEKKSVNIVKEAEKSGLEKIIALNQKINKSKVKISRILGIIASGLAAYKKIKNFKFKIPKIQKPGGIKAKIKKQIKLGKQEIKKKIKESTSIGGKIESGTKKIQELQSNITESGGKLSLGMKKISNSISSTSKLFTGNISGIAKRSIF